MSDLVTGHNWYTEARALAAELDPTNPTRAAAVIAVLSCNTGWQRNVQLARQAYVLAAPHGFDADVDYISDRLGTLSGPARKAALILTGQDPSQVVAGPKVTAFWQAITSPDTDAVVVDRHAYHIAVGRRLDEDKLGVDMYRRVAECYRRAAKILTRQTGWPTTAIDVQAVTWVTWRRIHGIDRRYGESVHS